MTTKNRYGVVLGAIVLIAIVALLRLTRHDLPDKAELAGDAAVAAADSSSANAAHHDAVAVRSGWSNGLAGHKANRAPVENKAMRIAGVLSNYNDVPIDFYGRVEDQSGNPVSGAGVQGSIKINNGETQTTVLVSTTSDSTGTFELHGRGESISAVPRKAGYALSSLNGGGTYSLLSPDELRVHSSPTEPIIIKMRKLQGAEPLANLSQHYKLSYTGSPINIDLVNRQIVASGGDIRLIVKRSEGVVSGRSRPDWSVRIEAVDGGIMDSQGQERVAYEAPDSGYMPGMTFTFSTNAPNNWSAGFDSGLFLVSRNKQVYSKVGLSFEINDQPNGLMNVTVSGVANANGSRNWEGDPNTMNAADQ